MQAEIITIGDEILIGQIVDTNSAWIAQKLNEIGIKVFQITSISDNKNHIINALDNAFDRDDLIILTGGLGPTNDDITKKTLAEYFHSPLIKDNTVLQQVEAVLGKRGVPMNELNIGQAEVPEVCRVIPNEVGTAPGMWFEYDGKVLISMPGVPFEMKLMMETHVIPALVKTFKTPSIYHKTIHVFGIPESALALKIADWENNLPSNIKLAYLPAYGNVRLRLSAYGEEKSHLHTLVSQESLKLKEILQQNIVGEDEETMEITIANLLKNNNKKLALAESCTGGNIAHLITLNPGSSAYYVGGVVAYSNEIKNKVLHVPEETLKAHGAVSQDTVEEMAKNVAMLMNADYGLSVSGIAGPDGGSEEKPVGTVWIAVYNGKNVVSKKFLFGDNRERNITRASLTALNMLRLQILQDIEHS